MMVNIVKEESGANLPKTKSIGFTLTSTSFDSLAMLFGLPSYTHTPRQSICVINIIGDSNPWAMRKAPNVCMQYFRAKLRIEGMKKPQEIEQKAAETA